MPAPPTSPQTATSGPPDRERARLSAGARAAAPVGSVGGAMAAAPIARSPSRRRGARAPRLLLGSASRRTAGRAPSTRSRVTTSATRRSPASRTLAASTVARDRAPLCWPSIRAWAAAWLSSAWAWPIGERRHPAQAGGGAGAGPVAIEQCGASERRLRCLAGSREARPLVEQCARRAAWQLSGFGRLRCHGGLAGRRGVRLDAGPVLAAVRRCMGLRGRSLRSAARRGLRRSEVSGERS